MVLLLGGDQVARTREGRALTAALDLSSGTELAAQAARDSPDAAQRVRLRKACIWGWMQDLARCDPDVTGQLVVPGAGLAPLALDWCATHPRCSAFELDSEHMDAKRTLIAQCASAAISRRISCTTCDVRSPQALHERLRAHGWNPQRPALWVLEGLSYYISRDELVALIGCAFAGSPHAKVILEFSGPRESLTPRARAHTEQYHQFIAARIGRLDLEVTDIHQVAEAAGARVERLVDPAMIEQQYEFPRYFKSADESAMRLALLSAAR